MRMTASFLKLSLTTSALILATGCGKSSSTPPPTPTTRSSTELLQSDRDQIKTFSSVGPAQFDTENAGLYSQIFGGPTGNDFNTYLDTRLHFYISDTDTETTISPGSAMAGGWAQDPDEDKNLKSTNAQVGAANVGITLWLGSLFSNTPVKLNYHGQTYPIDSSRVGIMLIGPGYLESVSSEGKTYTLPKAYRWSILAHEARHSDCTGGIGPDDIAIGKNAKNAHDFASQFTARACGHIHTYCPAGHQYHDLPACDSDPWGAYAIGAAFSRAMAKSLNATTRDWAFMMANAIDSETRALVPNTGIPDMSSSGVRTNE